MKSKIIKSDIIMSNILFWLLSPFALLYGLITIIRNKLYDFGLLKTYIPGIPSICIGNLTVGGTGKTPHTEFVLQILQDKYQTAVLSRGYGRKTKGFLLAGKDQEATSIGDESYQIFRKFPQTTVAVCEDRCNGIQQILKQRPATEVILLDDAFQHRKVKAGLNLLLTDYSRLHTRDFMMPAGRLREPVSGYKRSDIMIVTKCPDEIEGAEMAFIRRELDPECNKKIFFTSYEYGQPYPLFEEAKHSYGELTDSEILLVTGIASPEGIKNYLKKFTNTILSLSYSDHHHFSEKELRQVEEHLEALKSDRRMIIITEKDAARLINFKDITNTLKKYIFVLPIRVKVLNKEDEYLAQIIKSYVRKNKRNS